MRIDTEPLERRAGERAQRYAGVWLVQRGFGGTMLKRTKTRAASRLIGPIAPSETMVWTPPVRGDPAKAPSPACAKGLGAYANAPKRLRSSNGTT